MLGSQHNWKGGGAIWPFNEYENLHFDMDKILYEL